MTTTLLAVTGLSPAIVTETLWALAHEKPPILPNNVIFLTTATGAAKIEDQLFTPIPDWRGKSVWETLRTALHAGPDQLIAHPPRVITRTDGTAGRAIPLDDIRSPAENAAAAEFIFSNVWDIVRDKDHTLIASIAGGRKTMGALLHSAVSLIGREHDRVTHVLVDPPFESLPGFYFPAQPGQPLLTRDSTAHDPATARLHLADVPFVPLRNRFKDLDDLPASLLTLRNTLSERLSHDAEREIPIHIHHAVGTLTVDGKSHTVRPRALAILHFILQTNLEGNIPPDQVTAATRFSTWFVKNRATLGHIEHPRFDDSDIRRELNHLRDILKSAPWQPALRTLVMAPFVLTVESGESVSR
jgi:CRISPR-associated protein (TIGR02584 family)